VAHENRNDLNEMRVVFVEIQMKRREFSVRLEANELLQVDAALRKEVAGEFHLLLHQIAE